MDKEQALKNQQAIDEYRRGKIKKSFRQMTNFILISIVVLGGLFIWISNY